MLEVGGEDIRRIVQSLAQLINWEEEKMDLEIDMVYKIVLYN